jgi:hypothetical protein
MRCAETWRHHPTAYLIGGLVVIETIPLPGIGSLIYTAANRRFPMPTGVWWSAPSTPWQPGGRPALFMLNRASDWWEQMSGSRGRRRGGRPPCAKRMTPSPSCAQTFLTAP